MEERIKDNLILEIKHLNIAFTQYEGGMRQRKLTTIRDLDVEVCPGEIVAVVGSSGSGKSLLAHAVLGILPYNAKVSGEIRYQGELLTKERQEKLRGNEIVLVPQSLSYLDPLMKIGPQIRKGDESAERRKKLKDIFHRYDLKEEVEELYPFELSGGMNRRILISTAMIENPKLVIADEPTPGLDLKMAKRAMGHFRELADMGAGVLLITHDLELAIETADRVAVFYGGTTIEETQAASFRQEETLYHPYTKALWRAMPEHGFRLIKGTQPYVKEMPEGCVFAPRCEKCTAECRQCHEEGIPYQKVQGGRVRCLHIESE